MVDWNIKMYEDLDENIDIALKNSITKLINGIDDLTFDQIDTLDKIVSDTAEKYSDGVNQPDIIQAITAYQCYADKKLKTAVLNHLHGRDKFYGESYGE
jgi:Txe/YoeB family toxin of Txe-Axe toxin-antitoxin module|tara:strand:- start:994 stop:1290 length:297 start_codon:yes stop_codon:yes gene_type:complete